MKPPFVMSTFKWRLDIAQWLTESHNLKDEILVKWNNGQTTVAPIGSLHYAARTISPVEAVRQIYAIAELPTLDPDSEEFDFATACELMKAGGTDNKCLDGDICYSLYDDCKYMIDGTGLHREHPNGNMETITSISLMAILGKWRLA